LGDHLPPESVITFDRNTQTGPVAIPFSGDGSRSRDFGQAPVSTEDAQSVAGMLTLRRHDFLAAATIWTPSGLAALMRWKLSCTARICSALFPKRD
jgi:hypothetical protein